jgi:hypothetical protein
VSDNVEKRFETDMYILGYGLDSQGTGVRFEAAATDFLFSKSPSHG